MKSSFFWKPLDRALHRVTQVVDTTMVTCYSACMEDPVVSAGDGLSREDFRESLGLPRERRLLDDPSPRVVNRSELVAFHQGDLDPRLSREITMLITTYRDWSTASGDVLLELAKTHKEGGLASDEEQAG